MFEIKIDRTNAVVEFLLSGVVHMAEMHAFVVELQRATVSLTGRGIKIKADLRGLRPASPEVAEMMVNVQEFGIRTGVKKVAEIVESDIVALQLNRVARESGNYRMLRRFWDDDSARDWLLAEDANDGNPNARRSDPDATTPVPTDTEDAPPQKRR